MKKVQKVVVARFLFFFMLLGGIPCSALADETNARLGAIGISTGTLSPVFSSLTTEYNVVVSGAAASVVITPTAVDTSDTITITYGDQNVKAVANTVPLTLGTTAIKITVNGTHSGLATTVYTISVYRPSSAADISFMTGDPAYLTGGLDASPNPDTAIKNSYYSAVSKKSIFRNQTTASYAFQVATTGDYAAYINYDGLWVSQTVTITINGKSYTPYITTAMSTTSSFGIGKVTLPAGVNTMTISANYVNLNNVAFVHLNNVEMPQNYLKPAAYWSMDTADSNNAVIKDITGSGFDGIETSTSSSINFTKTTGKFDGAIQLTQASPKGFAVLHHPTFEGNTFTYNIWYKMPSTVTSGFHELISKNKNETVSGYFSVGIDMSTPASPVLELRVDNFWSGTAGKRQRASSVVTLDTWQMVTLVYNDTSGSFKMYVNGTSVTVNPIAYKRANKGTETLRFGARADGGGVNPFKGLMDDACFYDKALGDAEVMSLYQAYQSGTLLSSVSESAASMKANVITNSNIDLYSIIYNQDNGIKTIKDMQKMSVGAGVAKPYHSLRGQPGDLYKVIAINSSGKPVLTNNQVYTGTLSDNTLKASYDGTLGTISGKIADSTKSVAMVVKDQLNQITYVDDIVTNSNGQFSVSFHISFNLSNTYKVYLYTQDSEQEIDLTLPATCNVQTSFSGNLVHFGVNFKYYSAGGKIIAVRMNSDGNTIEDVTISDISQNTINIDMPYVEGKSYKMFKWDGITSMKPIFKSSKWTNMNIASGKPVTATYQNTPSPEESGIYVRSNVVDGLLSTEWTSGVVQGGIWHNWVGTANLDIDLENAYQISKIILQTRGNETAKNFDVLLSNTVDFSSDTLTVYAKDNTTNGDATITINPDTQGLSYRYLRIKYNGGTNLVIKDIEVYGAMQ